MEMEENMPIEPFLAIIKAATGTFSTMLRVLKQLKALNNHAEAPTTELQERVTAYLVSVQRAVDALGAERQDILREAIYADLRDPKSVLVLHKRVDTYLNKDEISRELTRALEGLKGCASKIKAEAESFSWRNNDNKTRAAEHFVQLLGQLELFLGQLTNFFPGPSGIGVRTLFPVYEKLDALMQNQTDGKQIDCEAVRQDIANAVRLAREDDSNRKWIDNSARVENEIAELYLSMGWRGERPVRGNGQPKGRAPRKRRGVETRATGL
jgi:hypothetical protein